MLGKRALRDSEKKLLVIDLNGVLLDGDAMKTERFGKEPLLTLLFSFNFQTLSPKVLIRSRQCPVFVERKEERR